MNDEPRKPRITPISRGGGGGMGRLGDLECFSEIDRRLRLGWTTPALTKAIQQEFGEWTDLSATYIKKLIDTYRGTIPAAELSMVSANSLVARNATRKLADGISELDELEKLYKLQEERIQIDFQNEKKLGKLFATTGREVFVAMKILRQSAELKMDLGLVKRQLGTMEVTGQVAAEVTERYGKDSIGKVISDPDSRRKVLGLAERLFQLGAKASLDVVDVLGRVSDVQQPDVIDAKPIDDAEGNENEGGSAPVLPPGAP
jgi:hypothetical protein